MKKLWFGFLFTCTVAVGQDLDFLSTLNSGGVVYPNGSLSNTYTNIGTPSVSTASVTVTGATTGFISSGGAITPRPVSSGIGLLAAMNFSANTDCVTFTIKFGTSATPISVANLTFNIYEIDKSSTTGGAPPLPNYIDQITVTAKHDANDANVTMTSNNTAVTTVSGSGTTTAVATGQSNGSTADFVSVSIPYASEVTIQYCNASGTRADPTTQATTIGDMTWGGPLPVILTTFTSKPQSNSITLNWATVVETNSSHFDIEHSTNARNFERIGSIKAATVSDDLRQYTFDDLHPKEGWNYYRLRQIDHDGVFEYSRIISALFEQDGTYVEVKNSTSNASLVVKTNAQNPIFDFYDSSGRTILQSVVAETNNQYKLLLAHGSSTMGILKVSSSKGELFIKKVLIID